MTCPECFYQVDAEDIQDYANGSFIDCPNCDAELEVYQTDDGGYVLELVEDYYDPEE